MPAAERLRISNDVATSIAVSSTLALRVAGGSPWARGYLRGPNFKSGGRPAALKSPVFTEKVYVAEAAEPMP